ncbi:hypothetical protein [Phocaeicola sp.]
MKKKSLFFTGGLDATSALAETAKEYPTLINIWGGDISIKDEDSHMQLDNYLKNICNSIGLQYAFIKSNCREMYNENKITKLCAFKIKPWQNHGWWAGIAHILSMTTLLAPLTYTDKIGTHYIGSSYSSKDKTFDANNNMLLQAINFCSCHIVSVDNNLERTQKAKKVIDFSTQNNIPIELKVCWYRKAGKNCSKCEKCYRTILDIIVKHGNPNKLGFDVSPSTFIEMKKFLENNYVNASYWNAIQENFLKEEKFWTNQPEISWILTFKFNGTKAIYNKIVHVLNRFL